jgi:hypothetical protein
MRTAWSIVSSLVAAAWLASAAPAAADPDLRVWVTQHTDLAPAQIAVANPELVYSVERLGSPAPTGEVIGLVRVEAVSANWRRAHGFASWDAHVLADCRAGRLRVIRSATYQQPGRGGSPQPEAPSGAWLSPRPSEIAARLTAAICDPDFAWPLRAAAAAGPTFAVQAASPASVVTPASTSPAAVAAGAELKAGDYAVQVARGPFRDGALRALPNPPLTLAASTETSRVGRKARYTAVLSGFPNAAAAAEACRTLIAAGQDCFTRRPAPTDVQAPPVFAADRIGGQVAAGAGGEGARSFAVQVARGPFADGAHRALEDARRTLGPSAEGVGAEVSLDGRGRRRRYVARLTGFATANAAEQACRRLAQDRRDCFVTTAVGLRFG